MQLQDTTRRSQDSGFAFAVDRVEGEIPAGLDGVLFRNGGGIFEVGETRFAFLDGYGLIGALEVADGQAHFRATHPESKVFVEERRAGRMLRRRVFTNLPGWRRNFFNVNPTTSGGHDSYVWNDQVHAADLGRHTSLSLPDLKTVGAAPWKTGPGELVAPMPRDDPQTGRLVSYVLQQSPTGGSVTLVEVDQDFNEVVRTPKVATKGLVHDVAFTDRWYVLVENAAKPNPVKALLGREPLWWSFQWSGAPPSLLLVPRGRDGDPVRIPMQDTTMRTIFHIVNAHDDGDDVVADVTGYDGAVTFDTIIRTDRNGRHRPTPTNHIARVRATPTAGTTAAVTHHEVQGEAPEVAPDRHGRPHSVAWYAALPGRLDSDPYAYVFSSAIGSFDFTSGEATTWDAGDGHQLSPPAFAPDPDRGPEEGWVLAWDLDLEAETTSVVVLDAGDLPAGPIARLDLGVYLPAVSHVRFAPGVRISGQ